MTDMTVLRLEGMGVPPYSARGLSQSLTPIQGAGQVLRTINGTLVDFSGTQFRKFQSRITGGDQLPPAVNGVWPGQLLTVDCITELAYETSTGGTDRAPVPGSERTEGDWSYYRPRLEMRVMAFEVTRDEYGAQVSWALDLEEV